MKGRYVAAALLAAPCIGLAQPAAEHEGHHPPPAQAAQPAGGAGMGAMGGEMGEMGAKASKETYPALMALPPGAREQAVRLVRERAQSGRAALDAAYSELVEAGVAGDSARAARAAARLREALALVESGAAAEQALAAGAAPAEVALSWFRREMGLPAMLAAEPRHGFFGLSAFHYVTMATVAAFALMLGFTTVARRRRGAVLAARLAAAPAQPERVAPPAPSVAGGWSGALRVARIFRETADVKTFRFAPTSGEGLPFTFEPGQFLTVAVPLGGKTVKRSYSIASSPCCHGWCEIAVRRVPGGVSEYLHERLREGDVIDASGPYGRFTFRGREAPSVVFIAGGVGITPLMSSIRFLTDQSWSGEIFLIYAAVRRDAIIFREELERLAARHANLHVTFVLSDEPSAEWKGARGFVTAELLQAAVPDLLSRRVHLCGPPPMMKAVGEVLARAGLPAGQLKTELFLSPEAPRPAAAPAAAPALAAATCFFTRSGKHASLGPQQTVLEAAESVGVAIDYSCRQGFCGVCKVKLVQGSVTMEVEDGLASAEKEAGIILACQARSSADVSVEA